ncbi:ALA-interacting subunit 1 [Hordeum vulgare]|nr:ALA-interacting subunit 1 [Hordeum vulgare]
MALSTAGDYVVPPLAPLPPAEPGSLVLRPELYAWDGGGARVGQCATLLVGAMPEQEVAYLEHWRQRASVGGGRRDPDKIAQHRYKDMKASEGKFFKLDHCWKLLQKYEKWKLIDKESLLLAKENKIMSMNRNDMDDLTKTWHDMARREILKRRMVFSASYGGNADEFQDGLDGMV